MRIELLMDSLGIGKLVQTEQVRDAIHVAVAPMEAAEVLYPGQRIGIYNGLALASAHSIGIVDPFLESRVMKGERFWMFLFPGTVTSLRHEWKHPHFDTFPEPPAPAGKEESKQWMEKFASDIGWNSEQVIDLATRALDYGEIFTQQDSQNMRDTFYDNQEDFWKHYQAITGRVVSQKEQDDTFVFSCSC